MYWMLLGYDIWKLRVDHMPFVVYLVYSGESYEDPAYIDRGMLRWNDDFAKRYRKGSVCFRDIAVRSVCKTIPSA